MAEGAKNLLIIEDDSAFGSVLKRSFERRGYHVTLADGIEAVATHLERETPTHAVVDLKLGTQSGLACIERLHDHDATIRIVVLTGYASIATAVEAIKLGASHYVAKPADTDDIEAAFARAQGDSHVPVGERPSSIKTLEWEHIHRVLAETDFNISLAARRLGMYRRTLARKLEKRHIK